MLPRRALRWPLLLALLVTSALPLAGQEAMPPPHARTTPTPQGPGPVVFRLLLLIKPESQLVTKKGACNGKMTLGDIKAVSKVFQETFPQAVRRATRARVEIQAEVTVSDAPLTKVTPVGKGQFWPAPGNVQSDLQRYTRPGEFDGVVVYWMNWDGKQKKSLPGGLGFTWPGLTTHGMGYSVMVYQNPRYWTGRGPATVFVHEWCHQLEFFYPKLGVKLPRQGLHGTHLYPGQGKNWYARFLNGEVEERDGSLRGLGETAWRLGTMRERCTPDYLTPERKSRNLLRNGSFEAPLGGTWTFGGAQPAANAVRVVSGGARDGAHSLVLQSAVPNELHVYQDVAVKPKTRYLLSGWAATERLQTRSGSNTGATLAVFRHPERSRSLTGDNEWNYVFRMVDTGKRTHLRVGAQFGGLKVPAVGRAAYDDLCLIEIERVEPTGAPVD